MILKITSSLCDFAYVRHRAGAVSDIIGLMLGRVACQRRFLTAIVEGVKDDVSLVTEGSVVRLREATQNQQACMSQAEHPRASLPAD